MTWIPSRQPPARKPPLAYFITFRTHGTWLPGDGRGSVHPSRNEWATEFMPAHVERHGRAAARMTEPQVLLTQEARGMVDRTIREVCGHRAWVVHALNPRTNHVHAVVTATVVPGRVMNDLKAWCTRRLVEAGLFARGERIWGRHGSTRYLWDAKAMADACEYAVAGQD